MVVRLPRGGRWVVHVDSIAHAVADEWWAARRPDVERAAGRRLTARPTGSPARTINLIKNSIDSFSMLPLTILLMVGCGTLSARAAAV